MLQAPVDLQLEGCWLVDWGGGAAGGRLSLSCVAAAVCAVACRYARLPKSHPHAGLAPVRTDVMRCSSKELHATKNKEHAKKRTTTAQPPPTHLQHKKGIIYEGRVSIQNEPRDINLTVCGGVSGHESLLCISCRRRRRLGNSSQIS